MSSHKTSRSRLRAGAEAKPCRTYNHFSRNITTTMSTEISAAMFTSPVELIAELQAIYTGLKELDSLAPGPKINALLTNLVSICVIPYSQQFVCGVFAQEAFEALCLALRPICATAEGELEMFWARKMIATSYAQPALTHSQGPNLLASFPYYQNYVDLAKLECHTLEIYLDTCSPNCRPSPCKLAFIGSGPMPLTSFCVLDRYAEATVHNIDRDPDALKISEELAVRCGYGGRMTFSNEDVSMAHGASTTDWHSFQVVFLAALVGMDTPAKVEIMSDLTKKLQPGTLVVARSAHGMRRVLYPVLDLSDQFEHAGLEILAEVHPWTQVVNSVVVMRVK